VRAGRPPFPPQYALLSGGRPAFIAKGAHMPDPTVPETRDPHDTHEAAAARARWFRADDRNAVLDLWHVLDRDHQAMAEDTLNFSRKHPHLHALLGSRTREQLAAETRASHAALAQAMTTGDWSDYQELLADRAGVLARDGLSFEAWCETQALLQRRLSPQLVADYSGEPRRLNGALAALIRFCERSSQVVGERYLAVQQEQRQAEAQARARAQEALEVSQERCRSMQEESRQIQQANRLKSEFLANMSHELRTPLNAIIGFAELLHDGVVDPASPQHKEFLHHILASGRHLLQLINDVLDLAKVESGKLEFHPEPIDLPTMAGEVLSVLRHSATHKRLELGCQVEGDMGEVMLDPARLKQVLYNYLSNAIKFTPDGGRILVRIQPEGPEWLRLEVEDNGVGISAAEQRRLFVEFQQLDVAMTKKHQGTGLGLALTRRLVEAQGGSVGVRSEPGQGSTFHALLPRRAAVPGAREVPLAVAAAAGSPVVLVVEDNSADRALIVSTLSRAGFNVETAATARQALTRCRDHRFHAITLDMVLPDMSGIEALREIRRHTDNAETPVIVVSISAERQLMAGFAVHDVLPKPLDSGALLGALQRAGVQPEHGGGVLVVDDDTRALDLMAASLAQLGYGAYCTGDGHQALEHARLEMPLAVIVDLLMPGMNGFEFLEHFRELPGSRHVPVIVWTIKDLTARERATLRLSSQAVVAKSGSAALMEELRAFLPERLPAGPALAEE
jgi:signal transduction histidine kinase/DNA-binding response OmpR family regulator